MRYLYALAAADVLPEQRHALQTLSHARFYFAAAAVFFGVLILLFGWKRHRWVVAGNCAAFGLYIGGQLGQRAQITTVGAVLGAVLLGLVCWPLMKYAVAVCGGVVGAVIGMETWLYFHQPMQMRWAGAAIGMVVLGLLCFILFKASVMVFCSVQGAIMLILGAAALLMKYTPYKSLVYGDLMHRPILMPLLVFFTALLGLLFQQRKDGLFEHNAAAKPAAAAA